MHPRRQEAGGERLGPQRVQVVPHSRCSLVFSFLHYFFKKIYPLWVGLTFLALVWFLFELLLSGLEKLRSWWPQMLRQEALVCIHLAFVFVEMIFFSSTFYTLNFGSICIFYKSNITLCRCG